MSPISIIIADDHPVVRDGIRKILDEAVGLEVVGEAADGAQALELVNELKPDVLLLDMELPVMSGSEVAQKIMGSGSDVRVLALSAHDDREYIQQLLSNGASGYLVKEEVPGNIVEAVRGVARGEKGWVSRRVAAQMSSWMEDDQHGSKSLSPREVEVLKGVVDGKTNQEIGFDLGISDKTVEKHLDAVFKKLNVASRVEAAVLAVREGWV